MPRIRCGAFRPAEPVDPRQQVGGDALHHPMHLAEDVGVQAAEIGHAGRGAHATEKSVALDQQRPPSGARRADRGCNAGRAAAKHHHVIFAIERTCRAGSSIVLARIISALNKVDWADYELMRIAVQSTKLCNQLSQIEKGER